jgi:hypothetical protein
MATGMMVAPATGRQAAQRDAAATRHAAAVEQQERTKKVWCCAGIAMQSMQQLNAALLQFANNQCMANGGVGAAPCTWRHAHERLPVRQPCSIREVCLGLQPQQSE